MHYRALGSSGIDASLVGLGTWLTGVEADEKASIRVIHAALDAGITLIDTAPSYGWGRAEEVLGRAVRGRREQAVIATKCGIWWADARGSFNGQKEGRDTYICLQAETVRLEVEASLKRLKVDAIDLLQVHKPAIEPQLTPIEETMGCLMDLKREGKVRAIGVSNVSMDQLDTYRTYGELDTQQFHYNMLNRRPERSFLPYCHDQNIASLTYTSLEQGLLTGKVTLDRQFEQEDFRRDVGQWMPWFKPENLTRLLATFTGWQELLEHYQCSITQLVIAWTALEPRASHVLCGSRSADQVLENAGGGDIVLSDDDAARITTDLDKLGAPN